MISFIKVGTLYINEFHALHKYSKYNALKSILKTIKLIFKNTYQNLTV